MNIQRGLQVVKTKPKQDKQVYCTLENEVLKENLRRETKCENWVGQIEILGRFKVVWKLSRYRVPHVQITDPFEMK